MCKRQGQWKYAGGGFYKHATAYRYAKEGCFDVPYTQYFYFKALKENSMLLPYSERHSNNQWLEPARGTMEETLVTDILIYGMQKVILIMKKK